MSSPPRRHALPVLSIRTDIRVLGSYVWGLARMALMQALGTSRSR